MRPPDQRFRAFTRYPEAILTALAEQLNGPDAAKAVERLGQAKDLKAACDAFGHLSRALVPKLREANLPEVFGFRCSMVKLPWVR